MARMSNNRYLRLGDQWDRHLQTFATLEQIGNEFGWSKQLAYYYTHVALGKFLHGMRQELGLNKHQQHE